MYVFIKHLYLMRNNIKITISNWYLYCKGIIKLIVLLRNGKAKCICIVNIMLIVVSFINLKVYFITCL